MHKGPEPRRLAHIHPHLWQGKSSRQNPTVATGFPDLDRALPAGGWPAKALTEVIVPYWGIGELRLLLPAMARLNHGKRRVVWVTPPYLPYAPALSGAGLSLEYVLVVDAPVRNVSWAMERALHAGECGMVIAWPPQLTDLEARRLQLAAEAGNTMGVVLHTHTGKWQAKPAALRLSIEPGQDVTVVKILKTRGNGHGRSVRVSL